MSFHCGGNMTFSLSAETVGLSGTLCPRLTDCHCIKALPVLATVLEIAEIQVIPYIIRMR